MSEFHLEFLSDDELDQLVRREDLGSLNFANSVEQLRSARKFIEQYANESDYDVPPSVTSALNSGLNTLRDITTAMSNLDVTNPNSSNEHTDLANRVTSFCDFVLKDVKPQIRKTTVESNALIGELDASLESAKAAEAQVAQILETVKKSAGDVGALKISRHYADQATAHRKTARNFLIAAAVLAVFLLGAAGLIAWLYLTSEPDGSTTTDWVDLVRQTLVKLVVLGVLSYALSFTVKAYRSNMHTAVVNEQKANALNTYTLFEAAMTTEAGRDVVTATLVQAVFAPSDSGFLDSGPEQPVMGLDPAVIRALLASRPSQ